MHRVLHHRDGGTPGAPEINVRPDENIHKHAGTQRKRWGGKADDGGEERQFLDTCHFVLHELHWCACVYEGEINTLTPSSSERREEGKRGGERGGGGHSSGTSKTA